MTYPHQPGSPQFDGAEAFEAYQNELDRLRRETWEPTELNMPDY